ncbi:MAG: DUF2125 domain-containing protein [Paracoccaceae bacterium]|nr:DUF2125 domain-containing protein [Paracoccaceae bacterium]
MTIKSAAKGTVCLAALFAGSVATADVTAGDVWADWQKNFGMYGEGAVSIGNETEAGGTLTVSDLAFVFDNSEVKITATIPSIVFTELGNGTVSVTMSDGYPVDIAFASEFGEPGSIKLMVNQNNLSMIVSGDPSQMNYAMLASRYGIDVVEIMEGDTKIDGTFGMNLNNVKGNYVTRDGNLRTIDYSANADSVDFVVDFVDPSGSGEKMNMTGDIQSLSMDAKIAMPIGAEMLDPEDLFAAGFAVSGGYGFGATKYNFDILADGDQLTGQAAAGSGSLEFEMNNETLAYNGLTKDVAVSFTGGGIPLPVEVSMAQYGFNLAMPTSKTDEPADFAFGLNLTDLQVSDLIWSIFDPQSVLPHDPATVAFNLSGKAKLYFDLFDPEQAEMLENADVPGEINALTLDDLKVAFGGALLTSEGAFTFDNDTPSAVFDGMPQPEGQVTVNLNGANGLMDKLVQMGLVPEQDIMGARMMMGMFARTVGDDELTSTLEVNGDGHVIVNGQRIQ